MNRGGPRSEQGKSRSRWNSAKHGLRSPAPVVPGLEFDEDWETHRQGMMDSLQPEGHLEEVLAERVALQSWRLHRVTRYERDVMALAQRRLEEEAGVVYAFIESVREASGSDLRETVRPETAYQLYVRGHEDLLFLEAFTMFADNHSLGAHQAGRILQAVANQVDEDSRLEDVEITSIAGPVNVATVGEEEIAWTASMVREAIAAMSRAMQKDDDELLKSAVNEARAKDFDAMKRVGGAEQVKEVMAPDFLLPDDKITRYEAHISRQLYQALHELEALQTRRSGGASPLGRLDVQGLPER